MLMSRMRRDGQLCARAIWFSLRLPCDGTGSPAFDKRGVVEIKEFHRSEYFTKMLGGSIYSTNLYQTKTDMILQ